MALEGLRARLEFDPNAVAAWFSAFPVRKMIKKAFG
jgi:hypothetical protein